MFCSSVEKQKQHRKEWRAKPRTETKPNKPYPWSNHTQGWSAVEMTKLPKKNTHKHLYGSPLGMPSKIPKISDYSKPILNLHQECFRDRKPSNKLPSSPRLLEQFKLKTYAQRAKFKIRLADITTLLLLANRIAELFFKCQTRSPFAVMLLVFNKTMGRNNTADTATHHIQSSPTLWQQL